MRDQDRQRHHVLGLPPADAPDHRRQCFGGLDDLRCDLASQLLKMKEALEAQETPAPDPDTGQPTIFLAEVTPDLEAVRDNIRRHLKQMNIRILPEVVYNRTSEIPTGRYSSEMWQPLLRSKSRRSCP
ncbi:hypothetical protein C2W62_27660 [Candidatus Entotheonella serta]|nr:hypothetical protein C2W62_27660 [Candidatus Entotheonella serta]